jgi:hypothetical protein
MHDPSLSVNFFIIPDHRSACQFQLTSFQKVLKLLPQSEKIGLETLSIMSTVKQY